MINSKHIFVSTYHNNAILTDKKSFILFHFLKLIVQINSVIGTTIEYVIVFSVNTRKRYNIMCIIRLYSTQYSQKT